VRFSSELLEEIRNRCDIVDIISGYVTLKPAGKNFKGLCPFHEEKTPSFMVSPQKQLFHCFGCGEGGNIFNFIMKFEKVEFPEAVEILAKKAGITLPTEGKGENFLYLQKERLYKLNNLAAKYYEECLARTSLGEKVIDYLKKRGIKENTVKKYRLGYAPPTGNLLITFLRKKGYSTDDLSKAGLVKGNKTEGRYVDYFRNRIIFPIFKVAGEIVGFGGRVLDNSLPKYINSPETLIYNKGENLYNLNFAKEEIRQRNEAIMVEGYTDVLIAQQYGFNQGVASLGTALTTKQVELIKRFTDRVLIAYDADSAGNMATLRGLDLFVKNGIEVKVIALPRGYDPADFLIKKGAQAFQFLIDNSLSLIDYKLRLLYTQYNRHTIEGKVRIIKEILPTLGALDNEVERRAQIKRISEELNLSEEAILIELRNYKRGTKKFTPANQIKTEVEDGNIRAEKILMGAMLGSKEIAEQVLREVSEEDFSVPLHQQIVSVIGHLLRENKEIDPQKVIDDLEDKESAKVISRLLLEEDKFFNQKVVFGCINTIKNYKLTRKIKELEKKARRLDEKIKKSEKIEESDLKELEEIAQQLKIRSTK